MFYTVLDDALAACAVRRHKVGTPVSDDVEVFREHDERFWLGVGLSFDERNIVIGTGSKTTTEVLMLPADTLRAGSSARSSRANRMSNTMSASPVRKARGGRRRYPGGGVPQCVQSEFRDRRDRYAVA